MHLAGIALGLSWWLWFQPSLAGLILAGVCLALWLVRAVTKVGAAQPTPAGVP